MLVFAMGLLTCRAGRENWSNNIEEAMLWEFGEKVCFVGFIICLIIKII